MRDAVGIHFRPAKNQDAVELRPFQQRHEQIEFLFGRDGINCMGDRFGGGTGHEKSTNSGSRKTHFVRRSISGGRVAEKRRVWRSVEIFTTIWRTCGRNPMSSKRSTS